MHMEWFMRSGSQPEIIINIIRHLLRLKIRPSNPIEFPVEPSMLTNGHLEWPAQQSALHKLFDRFHRGLHAIEIFFKPEPGIKAKNPAIFLHCFLHFPSFANGPRHWFFTPDILTGFCGFHGHDAMPMGWRGDVYNVNIFHGQHLAKILGCLHAVTDFCHGCIEVFFVNIANGNDGRIPIRHVVHSHAAHANDGLGQFIAWGHVTLAQ